MAFLGLVDFAYQFMQLYQVPGTRYTVSLVYRHLVTYQATTPATTLPVHMSFTYEYINDYSLEMQACTGTYRYVCIYLFMPHES